MQASEVVHDSMIAWCKHTKPAGDTAWVEGYATSINELRKKGRPDELLSVPFCKHLAVAVAKEHFDGSHEHFSESVAFLKDNIGLLKDKGFNLEPGEQKIVSDYVAFAVSALQTSQEAEKQKKLQQSRSNPAAASLAELLADLELGEKEDHELDEWNDQVAKKANKLVKWQQVGRALSSLLHSFTHSHTHSLNYVACLIRVD